MASEPVSFPPGTGAFRPAEDKRFVPGDHMSGWNVAIQNAPDGSHGRGAVPLVASHSFPSRCSLSAAKCFFVEPERARLLFFYQMRLARARPRQSHPLSHPKDIQNR